MFYLIALLLIAFIIVSSKKRNKAKMKSSQLMGIEIITELKAVISLVQQHRGLSSAWLNGENNVESKLADLKHEIQRIINRLHLTPINQSERWIGFSDHWKRLLILKNKPSAANSFEQHCLLIKNLTYLLEDMADSHYLTADYCNALPNIGYTWRELIVSTENIGQSRAIGTGVCVQNNCSSVDKIRLNFLTETMIKVTNETLQQLSHLPEESANHINLVQLATSKLEKLITTINQELINATTININHQEYFTLASEVLKSFDDIFEHQIKQLSKAI